MIKLTEKEKKVLKIILSGNPMSYCIYDPGSTITDVEAISKRTSFSINEVKGIVGSLVKKDLVVVDDAEDEDYEPHLTVISDYYMSEEDANQIDSILEEIE